MALLLGVEIQRVSMARVVSPRQGKRKGTIECVNCSSVPLRVLLAVAPFAFVFPVVKERNTVRGAATAQAAVADCGKTPRSPFDFASLCSGRTDLIPI